MDPKRMMETMRARAAAFLDAAEAWLERIGLRGQVALAAAIGLVATLGFLAYVSPYVALKGLQAALAERDAEAVARYLDREAIAESAGEIVDRVLERARKEMPFAFAVPDREREIMLARLREEFARDLSSVRAMLESFGPEGRDPETGKPVLKLRPERVGYAGPGRFEAVFGDGKGYQIVLVLGRRWLLFWKVVAIRFPDEFYERVFR